MKYRVSCAHNNPHRLLWSVNANSSPTNNFENARLFHGTLLRLFSYLISPTFDSNAYNRIKLRFSYRLTYENDEMEHSRRRINYFCHRNTCYAPHVSTSRTPFWNSNSWVVVFLIRLFSFSAWRRHQSRRRTTTVFIFILCNEVIYIRFTYTCICIPRVILFKYSLYAYIYYFIVTIFHWNKNFDKTNDYDYIYTRLYDYT